MLGQGLSSALCSSLSQDWVMQGFPEFKPNLTPRCAPAVASAFAFWACCSEPAVWWGLGAFSGHPLLRHAQGVALC